MKTVRFGDGETIFHAIVKTYRKGVLSPLEQVKTLEKLFGENSEVSLNTKDEHGNTCLHFACKNSPRAFSGIISLMIDRKCDLNEKNDEGQVPLQVNNSEEIRD
jgi:ankyrin repeat protein